jgi:hypothetical protein
MKGVFQNFFKRTAFTKQPASFFITQPFFIKPQPLQRPIISFNFGKQNKIKSLPKKDEESYNDTKQQQIAKGRHWTATGKLHPLQANMVAAAQQSPTSLDFKKKYWGSYASPVAWHLTDNPNFKIDPNKGPREMSSLSSSMKPDKGKLMFTTSLSNWDNYYNKYDADSGKYEKSNNDNEEDGTILSRPYAALLDTTKAEAGHGKDYWDATRGFGQESWVENPSKISVKAVYPIGAARKLDKEIHEKYAPENEDELEQFYKIVKKEQGQTPIIIHDPGYDEWHEREYGKLRQKEADKLQKINENIPEEQKEVSSVMSSEWKNEGAPKEEKIEEPKEEEEKERKTIPHWLLSQIKDEETRRQVEHQLFVENRNVNRIAEEYGFDIPKRIQKSVFHPHTTREEKIQMLQDFVEEHKRNPTIEDFDKNSQRPSWGVFRYEFGSWNNALKEAGLEPNKIIEQQNRDLKPGEIPSKREVSLELERAYIKRKGPEKINEIQRKWYSLRSPESSENRKKQKRDLYYKKIASMTPEELEEFRKQKREYGKKHYNDLKESDNEEIIQKIDKPKIEIYNTEELNLEEQKEEPKIEELNIEEPSEPSPEASEEPQIEEPKEGEEKERKSIPHWLLKQIKDEETRKKVEHELFVEDKNAGLIADKYDFNNPFKVDKSKRVVTTREEKIELIQNLEKELGRPPTTRDLEKNKSLPSSNAIRTEFGSWNNALREANITPINKDKPPKERELKPGSIPSEDEVHKEATEKWESEHPGDNVARTKKWREKNPEKVKEYKRLLYKRNKEKSLLLEENEKTDSPEVGEVSPEVGEEEVEKETKEEKKDKNQLYLSLKNAPFDRERYISSWVAQHPRDKKFLKELNKLSENELIKLENEVEPAEKHEAMMFTDVAHPDSTFIGSQLNLFNPDVEDNITMLSNVIGEHEEVHAELDRQGMSKADKDFDNITIPAMGLFDDDGKSDSGIILNPLSQGEINISKVKELKSLKDEKELTKAIIDYEKEFAEGLPKKDKDSHSREEDLSEEKYKIEEEKYNAEQKVQEKEEEKKVSKTKEAPIKLDAEAKDSKIRELIDESTHTLPADTLKEDATPEEKEKAYKETHEILQELKTNPEKLEPILSGEDYFSPIKDNEYIAPGIEVFKKNTGELKRGTTDDKGKKEIILKDGIPSFVQPSSLFFKEKNSETERYTSKHDLSFVNDFPKEITLDEVKKLEKEDKGLKLKEGKREHGDIQTTYTPEEMRLIDASTPFAIMDYYNPEGNNDDYITRAGDFENYLQSKMKYESKLKSIEMRDASAKKENLPSFYNTTEDNDKYYVYMKEDKTRKPVSELQGIADTEEDTTIKVPFAYADGTPVEYLTQSEGKDKTVHAFVFNKTGDYQKRVEKLKKILDSKLKMEENIAKNRTPEPYSKIYNDKNLRPELPSYYDLITNNDDYYEIKVNQKIPELQGMADEEYESPEDKKPIYRFNKKATGYKDFREHLLKFVKSKYDDKPRYIGASLVNNYIDDFDDFHDTPKELITPRTIKYFDDFSPVSDYNRINNLHPNVTKEQYDEMLKSKQRFSRLSSEEIEKYKFGEMDPELVEELATRNLANFSKFKKTPFTAKEKAIENNANMIFEMADINRLPDEEKNKLWDLAIKSFEKGPNQGFLQHISEPDGLFIWPKDKELRKKLVSLNSTEEEEKQNKDFTKQDYIDALKNQGKEFNYKYPSERQEHISLFRYRGAYIPEDIKKDITLEEWNDMLKSNIHIYPIHPFPEKIPLEIHEQASANRMKSRAPEDMMSYTLFINKYGEWESVFINKYGKWESTTSSIWYEKMRENMKKDYKTLNIEKGSREEKNINDLLLKNKYIRLNEHPALTQDTIHTYIIYNNGNTEVDKDIIEYHNKHKNSPNDVSEKDLKMLLHHNSENIKFFDEIPVEYKQEIINYLVRDFNYDFSNAKGKLLEKIKFKDDKEKEDFVLYINSSISNNDLFGKIVDIVYPEGIKDEGVWDSLISSEPKRAVFRKDASQDFIRKAVELDMVYAREERENINKELFSKLTDLTAGEVIGYIEQSGNYDLPDNVKKKLSELDNKAWMILLRNSDNYESSDDILEYYPNKSDDEFFKFVLKKNPYNIIHYKGSREKQEDLIVSILKETNINQQDQRRHFYDILRDKTKFKLTSNFNEDDDSTYLYTDEELQRLNIPTTDAEVNPNIEKVPLTKEYALSSNKLLPDMYPREEVNKLFDFEGVKRDAILPKRLINRNLSPFALFVRSSGKYDTKSNDYVITKQEIDTNADKYKIKERPEVNEFLKQHRGGIIRLGDIYAFDEKINSTPQDKFFRNTTLDLYQWDGIQRNWDKNNVVLQMNINKEHIPELMKISGIEDDVGEGKIMTEDEYKYRLGVIMKEYTEGQTGHPVSKIKGDTTLAWARLSLAHIDKKNDTIFVEEIQSDFPKMMGKQKGREADTFANKKFTFLETRMVDELTNYIEAHYPDIKYIIMPGTEYKHVNYSGSGGTLIPVYNTEPKKMKYKPIAEYPQLRKKLLYHTPYINSKKRQSQIRVPEELEAKEEGKIYNSKKIKTAKEKINVLSIIKEKLKSKMAFQANNSLMIKIIERDKHGLDQQLLGDSSWNAWADNIA